jgi:DNA-binding CsgD family transcriptional regulator/tetratricopeptide (TPR) repeat protein
VSSVVGREAELGALNAFLASDQGRVFAVLGEPGIGKTTVWEEAVSLGAAGGAHVLAARPAEPEARLSFVTLADLLSAVPDELFSRLPAPQRAALDAALLRSTTSRVPEPRLVGTAFLSILRASASGAPVLVAVDDLQWLDAPSASTLEFALRRLRAEPVRALVAARSQESERAPILRLGRELRVERLELGPLSVAALHRVLANELGRTFPRPTLVRIAQASGGNPLYALEIARLLVSRGEGADPTHLPVPTNLETLVRTRVDALPASTRSALLRAAALARPDTRLVDVDALAPAEEAGLVRIDTDGRIHFVHPLFASAVYSSAAVARRREVHEALADAVSDPQERARHLALGSDSESERVVSELAAAAKLALGRAAPDTAAELTELALRLVRPGTESAHELQLDLAEQLFRASDFQRAREILERLVSVLPAGDLLARALLRLADVEYWRRGESAALELTEQALDVASDPVRRAECLIGIAGRAGTVDLGKARGAARAAIELLERLPDSHPGLMAAALATRIRSDLFLGEGFDRDAAERALALETSAPPPVVDDRVTFKLGQWLRYTDDFAGAKASLVDAERQAKEEGDESSLANILLNRVVAATWAGDWDEAAELADRMIEAFEQQGVVSGDLGLWRAYVDAHLGDQEAVQAAAGRATREEPVIDAIWSRSLGLGALAAGDAQTADRHLSAALHQFDLIDFREPAIWRVDGDAIEAAVAVGDLNRAERWLIRLEHSATRSRIPWSLAVAARCRGLLLAAGGELAAASDSLESALSEHERCPMPFERARTLLVQGQVLRRLKRKRDARTALEAARAIFERLGSDAWVSRVDEELRRVTVRRAPDELSATELRVAQLAAAGLSNPEIASQVFVSRKTVEANLARAFRKLGVSSRAQLGRALDREARPIS